MPNKPLRPCAHPGCPELVESGRCPKHAEQYKAAQPKKRRERFYGLKPWLRFRAVYLRQHPLCEDEEGCDRVATHVHHIRELEKGGAPYDAENCQALCAHHHSKRHGYGGGKDEES